MTRAARDRGWEADSVRGRAGPEKGWTARCVGDAEGVSRGEWGVWEGRAMRGEGWGVAEGESAGDRRRALAGRIAREIDDEETDGKSRTLGMRTEGL
jgi:hypothetical protein